MSDDSDKKTSLVGEDGPKLPPHADDTLECGNCHTHVKRKDVTLQRAHWPDGLGPLKPCACGTLSWKLVEHAEEKLKVFIGDGAAEPAAEGEKA